MTSFLIADQFTKTGFAVVTNSQILRMTQMLIALKIPGNFPTKHITEGTLQKSKLKWQGSAVS